MTEKAFNKIRTGLEEALEFSKAHAGKEYPQDIVKAADDVCIAMNIPSTVENCLPIMDALLAERERSQWQPMETAPWHKEVLVYSEEGGTGVLLAQFTSLRGLISDSEIDDLIDQGMTEDEIDANAWFYCDFGGGARLEADCAPSRWMHLPNEEPRAEV